MELVGQLRRQSQGIRLRVTLLGGFVIEDRVWVEDPLLKVNLLALLIPNCVFLLVIDSLVEDSVHFNGPILILII